MQATTSHVTSTIINTAPVFIDSSDDEIGHSILPVLKKAASDAGRDHLLVRRRRRSSRYSAR